MSEPKQQTTPVLVLSSGHHAGLGIVRSLDRLGVPVYVAGSARWDPAFSSRYCRGSFRFHVEDESAHPAGELVEIGRKLGGRPLLIPTTDQATIWVAENAATLDEAFRFTSQDTILVRTLCDKSRMQELARRCGVPVARSILPHCAEDVEKFAWDSVFPVMVKATDAERLRRRTGGTKFLVHTAGELLDLYAKAHDGEGPNLLIQEFVPGEDWMFDGYFDADSHCVFGITGKKIRRFPVRTGVTSLGICLRNDLVHSITTEFMRAIGYRGILDIGFRYDWRDGQYKVMDVNPRIGCTFRLFAAAGGMDVARALYMDATGRPVPATRAIEGRKWIVEDFDLISSIRSLWEGSISPKEWAQSLDGIQEAACFAGDDPLPFLMMAVSDIFEFSKWHRRRAATRKAPAQEPLPALTASTRRR